MSPLACLSHWPGVAAAAATGPGGFTTHHGPIDQPMALASVTKLLTAMAVLVAHEEGTLPLDEPVTDAGASSADLLAHSAGLAPDRPDQIATIRTRRMYSTAAYDLLGDLVAKRSGMPFVRYLTESVLDPLGMQHTSLTGSPGAGGSASVSDLLRLAEAWCQPVLIDQTTLTRATTVHLPELAGVLPGFGRHTPNPWGLGPEIRGNKVPHWTSPSNHAETFGHFGQAGTMLWIDPVAEVTLVALCTEPFGSWAVAAWPELSTAVLTAANHERTTPTVDG
jgi:CubicO group peptidase (beta-lactamase class C family)